ncbi:MAG TPA: hypothetical protein VFA07_03105 [Chthonomonadaceae bacterium]|nr:hypothetical protein [Chthonomonadaceae bacterium]
MNKQGHHYWIERLRAGETVSFREKGNSMVPRIKSRQKCTYAPVGANTPLKKGDMVFCKVGGMFTTHLISAIRGEGEKATYQISNNHGHVNGWVSRDCIFGIVIQVED